MTGLSLDADKRRIDVSFVDGPLQVGDSFELKVGSNSKRDDVANQYTWKLKVVDGSEDTGELLVGDPEYSNTNRTYVIAIAASDVTGSKTGADIAAKIKAALTVGATNVASSGKGMGTAGTADFVADSAAAVAVESFNVKVDTTTGLLSISTLNATGAELYSFNSSKTDYNVLLKNIDNAEAAVTNAAASFGTAATRIDLQKDFLDKLVDTLNTGLGALVDADMSEEAARLQALQVQEQLGTQALSIANQAPQSILRLFQ
ncbi:flagellin [Pseudoroseomonas wenyumeiae]